MATAQHRAPVVYDRRLAKHVKYPRTIAALNSLAVAGQDILRLKCVHRHKHASDVQCPGSFPLLHMIVPTLGENELHIQFDRVVYALRHALILYSRASLCNLMSEQYFCCNFYV